MENAAQASREEEDVTVAEQGNFGIELAVSSRSKCQHCKKMIVCESPRVYKLVRNLYQRQSSGGHHYLKRQFHLPCFFKGFARARTPASVIHSTSQLDGFEKLSDELKDRVTNLLNEYKRDRNTFKPMILRRSIADTCISGHKGLKLRETRQLATSCREEFGLKVLYTNADVLTACKMTELRQRVAMEKPKIVIVNEVLPKNSKASREDADFKINNFTIHRWTSGRGINIWTHQSLDKSISIPLDKQLTSDLTEAAHIRVRLNRGDSLLLSCLYRSSNQTEEGNNKTNEIMKFAARSASHVALCGDFNYRDIQWATQRCSAGERSQASQFLDAAHDSFLYQHVKDPTRHRTKEITDAEGNKLAVTEKSLLDLVFTNEQDMITGLAH